MAIERDTLNMSINVDSADAKKGIKELTDAIRGFEAAADQASKSVIELSNQELALARDSVESSKRIVKAKQDALQRATASAQDAAAAQQIAAEEMRKADFDAMRSMVQSAKQLAAEKRKAYDEITAVLARTRDAELKATEDVERATERQIKASRDLVKAEVAAAAAKGDAAKAAAAEATAALKIEEAATAKRIKSQEELGKAWENAGKDAESQARSQEMLNSSMTKAAVVVTAVAQALAVAKDIYRSIKGVIDTTTAAFAVQEKAELDLANALKINGEFTQATFKNFKDFATQLQATSTVSDESTLSMLKVAKAMRLTDQQAKDTVTASAALAAVTGEDLNSAFTKVSKTFGGMAGELGEKLPMIRSLTKEQLFAGKATQVLIDQFGAFIKISRDTFSGKQLAAANAFSAALEQVGRLFVDVFDLKGRLENTERKFLAVAAAVDEFRRKLLFLMDNVSFKGIIDPLIDMAQILKVLLIPVLVTFAAIIGVVLAKVLAFAAAIASIGLAVDLIVRNIKQFDVVMRLIANTFVLAVKKMTIVFGDFVAFVIEKFRSMLEAFNQSGAIPDAIAKPAIAGLKSLADGVFKMLFNLDQDVEATTDAIASDFAKLGDKGLVGGFVELIGSIQKAVNDPKFGAVTQDITDAGNAATKATRAQMVDQEALLRLAEERRNTLEQILEMNRTLALEIKNFGEDERQIALNNLAFQLDGIDQEIAKLKEKKIIVQRINAAGVSTILAGQEILDGLTRQKQLLIEITQLNIETLGESFARIAKEGIQAAKEIFEEISNIDFKGMFDTAVDELSNFNDKLMSGDFEGISIDFAGNADSLIAMMQEAGKSFVSYISNPNNIADLGGVIIDAFDAGLEVFDDIMDGIGDMFEGITDLAGFALSFNAEDLAAMKKLPEELVKSLKLIPEFIAEGAKAISGAIQELVKILPQIVAQIIQQLPALIDAILKGLMSLIDMLPGIFAQFFEALPDMISQIFDAIPTIIEKLLVAVPQIVASLFKAIPQIITNILDRLPEIIQALIAGLIGSISEIVVAFIDTFITRGGAFKIAESIVKAFIQMIPAIVNGIIDGLKRAIKSIFSGLPAPKLDFAPLEKKIEDIFNKVVKGATGIAEQVFGLIDLPGAGKRPQDIVKDPVAGITEVVGQFIGKVSSLWQQFLDALKKLWMWIWEKVLEPIFNLIRDAWLFVWNKVIQPLIDFLFNTLGDLISDAFQFIIDFFEGLGDLVMAAWSFLIEFFEGLGTLISNAWSSIINVLESLPEIVSAAWAFLVEYFNTFWEVIKNAWAFLITYFETFVDVIKAAWAFLIEYFNVFGEVIKNAWSFVVLYFSTFGEVIKAAWSFVVDFFSNLLKGNIDGAFASVFDFFNRIGEIFAPVFDAFKKIFQPLEDLKKPLEDIIKPFNNLVEPLKNVVRPMENLVEPFNKLRDAFSTILGPFRSLTDALNKFKPPSVGGGGGGGGGVVSKAIGVNVGFNSGGLIPRYQNGGGIDSQIAWVTPGEFVMSRNTVDSVGTADMNYINRTGRLPEQGESNTSVLKIESGAIVITGDNRSKDDIADAVIEKIKELSLRGRFVIADGGIRIV